MSFKPYTEKLRRKKLEFGRFQVGSGSIIPEADPRIQIRIRIKMIGIRNTGCHPTCRRRPFPTARLGHVF